MAKRERMLEIAALTLSVGAALGTPEDGVAAPKKGQKTAECYGINTCRGNNGCAISKDHIEAANKVYKEHYTKSKIIDCAGNSEGSAKGGVLTWVSKPTNDECWKEGGFVFEKDAGGKLIIRDKEGVRKPG
ncbi:MAG: hypothetical protein M3Q07_14775 [Pseudobdellovibrionaceae bacterium]|nr:hypothetical protein [Pseudobdellovibrionaceae bacterium]